MKRYVTQFGQHETRIQLLLLNITQMQRRINDKTHDYHHDFTFLADYAALWSSPDLIHSELMLIIFKTKRHMFIYIAYHQRQRIRDEMSADIRMAATNYRCNVKAIRESTNRIIYIQVFKFFIYIIFYVYVSFLFFNIILIHFEQLSQNYLLLYKNYYCQHNETRMHIVHVS